MGFYERRIFPWLMERAARTPAILAINRAALSGATGRVLEIGIGSAASLPLYPSAVTSVVGIDPNPGMNRRAQARARVAPFPVELRALSGESLPFPAASFDTAVSTLVLCSIPDAVKAVAEVRRVLKPGGRFLFVEHGLNPDPAVRVWQRRLNPLQHIVACGCVLDKDIPALIAAGGFALDRLRTEQVQGVPRTHGTFYVGQGR